MCEWTVLSSDLHQEIGEKSSHTGPNFLIWQTSTVPSCFPHRWCKWWGVVYIHCYSIYPQNSFGFAVYCISSPMSIYWCISLCMYSPCTNILVFLILSVNVCTAVLIAAEKVEKSGLYSTKVPKIMQALLWITHQLLQGEKFVILHNFFAMNLITISM